MKRITLLLALYFLINLLPDSRQASYAQRNTNFYDEFKCSIPTNRDNNNKLTFKSPPNPLLDKYNVKFYKIDLEADNTSIYIEGNVVITAEAQETFDTLVFELINSLTVDSVFVDEIEQTFSHIGDEIYIYLDNSIFNGNTFSAQIYYHGISNGSGILNEFSLYWGNQVTWTLSESFHLKDWMPCKQSLTDKVDSVYVFITTDSDLYVGSNGLLTAITPMPGGKVRYEWKSYYPIAYYLISFTIASYVEYNIYAKPTGLQDSILIQNYVYDNPQTLPFFQNNINKTKDCIELLSELYGMYPFKNEKYGHCMAPIWGAMEHQTMTTIGYFSFGIIIHELGHQWFGNNVTCATWQDIWINEGFASYSEYLGGEYLPSIADETPDVWMADAHDLIMSEPDGSVYVPLQDVENEQRIFDSRLSYKKGAAIIHMLRFELQNDSVFFQVLKEFQNQFSGGTATGLDFKNVLETISGMDFTDFFNQWYFGEGYPIYDIIWNYNNDTLTFTSIQTTSTSTIPLFKMSMEYKLNTINGDTLIRVYQNQNVQTYKIYIPDSVTNFAEVDPNNWVINLVGSIDIGIFEEYLSEAYFSIAPNPFSENIFLRFLQNNVYTISLMDITGRIISEYKTNKHIFEIPTNSLSSGIYLIKISANDGQRKFLQKIIKY